MIPLSKTGIALGSIFVITLVMGDFFVVQGHERQPERVGGLGHDEQIAMVQYPPAAASAVILLIIVTPDGGGHPAHRGRAQGTGGVTTMGQPAPSHQAYGKRPWTFYALAAFFALFVAVPLRSDVGDLHPVVPGPDGRPDLPDAAASSLHWFHALFAQERTGDFAGAFTRSMTLAVIVADVTVCLSVMAGLAFRRRFRGSTFVFYLAIASLIMPGLLVGLGIGLDLPAVRSSDATGSSPALGAQLTWTLPFGLLIMFAVLSRFNRAYRGSRRATSARATGRCSARWSCRSCCRASSAWRCSASPCPTTSFPARC